MQPAENFIIPWHENLHGHSDSFLDTILEETVTFHSPVVFRPIEGKDLTRAYLIAAGNSFNLNEFKYTNELHVGTNSILEFETKIDEIFVNGVDMIEWNDQGKIKSFKVMIRPYQAVEKVKEKMQEALEALKNV